MQKVPNICYSIISLHSSELLFILPGAHKGRSVQLRGTAFESEQLEHLPYMDLSSSGHKCCYHSQCIKAGIHYAAL